MKWGAAFELRAAPVPPAVSDYQTNSRSKRLSAAAPARAAQAPPRRLPLAPRTVPCRWRW